MNKVRKQAKQFFRSVKGDLSYSSLRRYIYGREFVLIELHTEKGDKFLKYLGKYDEVCDKGGYTMNRGDGDKYVVIDSNLHMTDKIKVLLHEICHVDNHMTYDDFKSTTNIQREQEAEAFAYEVISLQNSIFNLFKRKEAMI